MRPDLLNVSSIRTSGCVKFVPSNLRNFVLIFSLSCFHTLLWTISRKWRAVWNFGHLEGLGETFRYKDTVQHWNIGTQIFQDKQTLLKGNTSTSQHCTGRHSDTETLRHMDTQIPRHRIIETQKYRDTVTQRHSDTETGRKGKKQTEPDTETQRNRDIDT